MEIVTGALEQHVRRYFGPRQATWLTAEPMQSVDPQFRVLQLAPAGRDRLWHYVSIGAWSATAGGGHGVEFILSTAMQTARAVELLAMNVYYHREDHLGLGHTVPIGEPWLPGSECDHLLVSLPYPFGPRLQRCQVAERYVDFLWLVPITRAERDFKTAHGQEELEQQFEAAGLRYWEADRKSVV
jgi:hypothetical protein